MAAPARLALLVLLAAGCATGSGGVEGEPVDDAGDPSSVDAGVTPLVDALTFPRVDRPATDAPVVFVPSQDVPAAAVDAGVSCAAPRAACGGGCVDVTINPAHCGGCDRPCAVGAACVAGVCQTACAAPRAVCNGACIDPSADVAHCGACGVRCAAGQTCAAGVCRSPASATTVGLACTPRGGTCGANLCRIDWPGGYCTDYCLTDRDCGPDSLCISDGWDDFCGRACTSSAQCRAGYGCYRITATLGACVPI